MLFYVSNPKRQPINCQSDLRALRSFLPPIHAQYSIVVPVKETILEMEFSVNKRDVRRLKQVIVKQEFCEFFIAVGQFPAEIIVLQQFECICYSFQPLPKTLL